jgi:hypothetical protein
MRLKPKYKYKYYYRCRKYRDVALIPTILFRLCTAAKRNKQLWQYYDTRGPGFTEWRRTWIDIDWVYRRPRDGQVFKMYVPVTAAKAKATFPEAFV